MPFVATASAALVMAEALKALLYPDAVFTQWFQMESIFLGPDASLAVLSPADPACECTLHRSVIEDLAQRRHVKPNPAGTAG